MGVWGIGRCMTTISWNDKLPRPAEAKQEETGGLARWEGTFSPVPVQLGCWHLSALLAEGRQRSFPSAFSLLLQSFPPEESSHLLPQPFPAPSILSVFKYITYKHIHNAV